MEYKVSGMKFTMFFLCLYSSLSCNGEFVEHKHSKNMATITIQGANGDIFDCVDFKLQPTFQDPLFKNHTIQISPSSYPYSGNFSSNDVNLQSEIETIGCPVGTVPIWRNYRKPLPLSSIELLTSKLMQGESLKKINFEGTHTASILVQRLVFGTRASISVHEPHMEVKENAGHSGSTSLLANGPSLDDSDYITAGWYVWPEYSNDNHVRLFTYWKDSNRHKVCLNLLCSGFVQVSSDIALGSQLKPVSVYGGQQYKITIQMFKDSKTGNWWLTFGENNKPIGYWDKSILPHMKNSASKVAWGGTVQSLPDEPSPPMGSGYFPSEGFGKSAFYQDVKVIYDGQNLIVPKIAECLRNYDRPKCYKVSTLKYNNNGIGFYFGGPGGCKH